MKVFVAGVDTPFGHNISNVLSQTVVGHSRSEEENDEDEDEQPQLGQEGNGGKPDKPLKETYTVVGTLQKPIPDSFESHLPTKYPAKPGKMIETGDKKKDAARREAIDKIPRVGQKPKGSADREQAQKMMMESDVIVYDMMNDLDEITWALDYLSTMIDSFEKPKIFIAISTVMTWAKTKGDADDPEAAFAEDEYRKRKPHPNFKNHLAVEKNIVKLSKKEKFKGYVIAPGLIYHAGNSIFHYLFKAAWHNEPALNCFGDGSNVLPTIHLDDLIAITVEVIETSPEVKYIVAVDESKSTLYEITKAIADSLSNGVVKKVGKEEGFLEKSFTQEDIDMLTVNLRMEPAYIKDLGLEWKYELIQEYKDARGLWALKIVMHGPPASGKTFYAQKIAELYKIHYLETDEVVNQALIALERRVNGQSPVEDEETDLEADRELLNEMKEAMRANNGKLPTQQTISFVKDKLKSMPCKNQGYILDGFPTTMEEAAELFKPSDDDGKEERIIPVVDDVVVPEFVFTIEMSDLAIKQRIQKLPESAVVGTKNSEEALTKRLDDFRKNNTDELTVLNYFDELEISPAILQAELLETNQIIEQIQKELGEPRNYGLTPEQIAAERKEAEKAKLNAEAAAAEERFKRQQEEIERHNKATAEWNAKLEQVRKQEQEVLEIQSEPLRNYLVKYIMPTLTAGLVEVAKIRPEDPIDYLAEFLFKQNPENNSSE
ncbi:Adenylate kinase 7 [Boothiomyces macroporosus]|uniref:Adenylate kinase 7 n=1 Tax=Boothiomyces macroporosus TaxID=261099 RepID=A0AAD5Y7C0_9FUNG|nr:Adenylate kinase 7 [Boothiomyces macroporosus]